MSVKILGDEPTMLLKLSLESFNRMKTEHGHIYDSFLFKGISDL
jgi:hypothetical protein